MGGIGSGSKPRKYPQDIVTLACELYEAGLTVAEIRKAFPKGYRVQTILERHLPERRPAVPRDQSGERNPNWKGSRAGYDALHLRVQQKRGRPAYCERCDSTSSGRFEWANLTGNYADVNDYARMCVPCHRAFDFKGRRPNGQFVSLEEAS